MLPDHTCPACAGKGACPVCLGNGTRWAGMGRHVHRLICHFCAGVGACPACAGVGRGRERAARPAGMARLIPLYRLASGQ